MAITLLQPWAILAKGPPWMKAGGMFERLHKVGFQRVLEQCGHRALDFDITGGNRLAAAGVAENDPCHPLFQIRQVAR